MYQHTMKPPTRRSPRPSSAPALPRSVPPPATRRAAVTRVQTGVRLEKRLLKVTKALADSLDLTLSDLLEGVLLHALDGKLPFSAATQARAAQLKQVFGLELGAGDAHRLIEPPAAPARRAERP
jgi:hypothetical protein